MQNYNLIIGTPKDISDPSSSDINGKLQAEFFPVVTSGIPTITISSLIDANILGIIREDGIWKQVSDATALTNRTYHFDEDTGDLEFFTDLNPDEELFIMFYTGTGPVTYSEPVTLAQFKKYARQEGFMDEGQSISDFDYDDELINDLLVGAREVVERWCNISIVPKAWRVFATSIGGLELPNGPVNGITSITFHGETSPTSEEVELMNDILQCPTGCKMKIEYLAGYAVCPPALKIAIMKQALWDYIHRGDELLKGEICQDAMTKAEPFRRGSWLV